MPNVRVTFAAASKFSFPACLAVIELVPYTTAVMTNPATVQIPVVVDVRVTVNDEETVDLTD